MSWIRRVVLLSGLLSLAACGTSQAVAVPGASSPAADVAASATASAAPTAPASPVVAPATCGGKLTPAETEGPYFKAGSAERASLVDAGMAGTRLTLSGRVTNAACQPLAHAMLDFWQADASGNYDNSGYRLRGHVFTDADGNYRLDTIVPGLYTGRTEHIHVKVQPAGGAILTTQLFFPGVPQNDSDGIYNPALLLKISDNGSGKLGAFDFVV